MTALQWDSKIKNDGGDFKLLTPGIYPAEIRKFERGYFNGSNNIPPCPRAELTFKVGSGLESSDVSDRLILDDSLEWKLCQFFRAIGARKHGEELTMNWDEGFLIGKKCWVEISNREYTNNEGDVKHTNQIDKYLPPEDAPKDGKPIIKDSGEQEAAADEW